MLLHAEPLAQKAHDGCELLVRGELEDALVEVRRGADGLQADCDFRVGGLVVDESGVYSIDIGSVGWCVKKRKDEMRAQNPFFPCFRFSQILHLYVSWSRPRMEMGEPQQKTT